MCGIFACVCRDDQVGTIDVGRKIGLGLLGLQHRGQESAGIVTCTPESLLHDQFVIEKNKGLVSSIFTDEMIQNKFKGSIMGIGHNRYSTAGMKDAINCIQPFVVYTVHGPIAVAHNGELVNAKSLRQAVLLSGVGLSTDTDSELLAQLIASAPSVREASAPDWAQAVRYLMSRAAPSYSLVVMTPAGIFATRDPLGNRPLCLGEVRERCDKSINHTINGSHPDKSINHTINGSHPEDAVAWVVASESCTLMGVGAELIRDVEHGEIVFAARGGGGFRSLGVPKEHSVTRPGLCIFEYVYFSRADSILDRRPQAGILEGQQVYSVRHRCGVQLAREATLENADPADCIVSTVPDSATPAAMGFALQARIPYTEVLCKNGYVGRTFIQPSDMLRKRGVSRKFGALADNYRGKRVVLIDDSIVRGNTMKPIVQLLKRTGALEVHLRVASPPIRYPCFMGINIPSCKELIAHQLEVPQHLLAGQNIPELAEELGADSVVYLTLDGLVAAVSEGLQSGSDSMQSSIGFCTACLDKKYLVKPDLLPDGLLDLDW